MGSRTFWSRILRRGFASSVFRPRTRPKTSLQCFSSEQRESKANQCRDVLERVLGRKNKVQNLSLYHNSCRQNIRVMHEKLGHSDVYAFDIKMVVKSKASAFFFKSWRLIISTVN